MYESFKKKSWSSITLGVFTQIQTFFFFFYPYKYEEKSGYLVVISLNNKLVKKRGDGRWGKIAFWMPYYHMKMHKIIIHYWSQITCKVLWKKKYIILKNISRLRIKSTFIFFKLITSPLLSESFCRPMSPK